MEERNNRILMQTKDVAVILGILAIMGYLVKLSNHVTHWDDTVNDVSVLKTLIAADTAAIQLLQSHYQDIKDDLREIKQSERAITKNMGGG